MFGNFETGNREQSELLTMRVNRALHGEYATLEARIPFPES